MRLGLFLETGLRMKLDETNLAILRHLRDGRKSFKEMMHLVKILTVLLNEELDLLTFYTEEVSRVSELGSAETFVVYKGYNARVPYIL